MKNKKWMPYVITTAIGLLVAVLVLYSRNVFSETLDTAALMTALCDAALIPGGLLFCVGLLLWIAETGQFDMLRYGFHFVYAMFVPSARISERDSFYEYKTQRNEKRKKSPKFLIWIGLGFLLLSVIFVIAYYAVV